MGPPHALSAGVDELSARAAAAVLTASDPLRALARAIETFPALFLRFNGSVSTATAAEAAATAIVTPALGANRARLQRALVSALLAETGDQRTAVMLASQRGPGNAVFIGGESVPASKMNVRLFRI